MDWVPILSQTKSLFQVICGDTEGARQTQENFLKTCPGISQGTSLVQLIAGDHDGALETQKAFGRTVSGVVNGIPVVGHVKGVVHYVCGDKEGGDQAIKSSTRTIGVMGGGVGGFVVGGPLGAVAGGIASGTAMDALTTGIDSAIHGEYRPSGHIATVTEIVKSDKNPSGKIFDLTAGVVFDGLTGQAAGQAFGQEARQAANNYRANKIRENARAAFEKVENNPAATSGELKSAGEAAMVEMKRADAIQGIKTEFTKTGQTVHTESANNVNQQVYTNSNTSNNSSNNSNNNNNNNNNNQNNQRNCQSSNVVIDIDVSNMTVEEAIRRINALRAQLNREIRVRCKSLYQAAAIAETIVQRKNLDRQNRTITYGVNECSLEASIFYEQITGYTMTSKNMNKKQTVTVRLDTNEHDQTHLNYEYIEKEMGEPDRTERLALFYPDTGSQTIDIVKNFTDQLKSRFEDNIEELGKYIKEIFENMRRRFLGDGF